MFSHQLFSSCLCQCYDHKGNMVNGLYLTSCTSKRFTIFSNIHPFMHPFTHRLRCRPCKATDSTSGAVRMRCLAQGHLDTRTGNLSGNQPTFPVTSQPSRLPANLPGYQPTFRLPAANPLYLLSHMTRRHHVMIRRETSNHEAHH